MNQKPTTTVLFPFWKRKKRKEKRKKKGSKKPSHIGIPIKQTKLAQAVFRSAALYLRVTFNGEQVLSILPIVNFLKSTVCEVHDGSPYALAHQAFRPHR